MASSHQVLIVTGSLLTPGTTELLPILKGQWEAFQSSTSAWLDAAYKVRAAEALVSAKWARVRPQFRSAPYRDAVERYFSQETDLAIPELTEVVLATLLEREGMTWAATTWSDVYSGAADELLAASKVVFASTTLLRDLSELIPSLARIAGHGRKVVVGGALVPLLGLSSSKLDLEVTPDVWAVGYGELLMPSLAAWIKSDFRELCPPETGRLETTAQGPVLHSGTPASKSLDGLPEPDWSLAERFHGRKLTQVHYESVRGCPYRCAFCNYPYLFDDTKFRTKSAERIAKDWDRLAKSGVEYISCLDSLFTMPRRRLIELCDRLVALGTPIRWICYARADDLADPETTRRMKAAGCVEVQIGIESGDQSILDAMNKRTTVEKNRRALEVCREVGLTSLVTVIVGYPGETERTVDATFELLRTAPPDFFYVAPFNTRVESVPVLSPESRAKNGLVTLGGVRSSAPYWRHRTMSCERVPALVEGLKQRMAEDRVALEGTLFYAGSRGYRKEDRDLLLDFQRDVYRSSPLRRVFEMSHQWIQKRLVADVASSLSGATV